MTDTIRLDKMIAHATQLPRSQVKLLLRQGRFSVNGITEKQGKRAITPDEQVFFDNQLLSLPQPIYLMMNKPAGYVSTHEDDSHPSFMTLLDGIRSDKLHAAGRLDADTTGLLLITDDGQWSHQITSPRRQKWKTYRVELTRPISNEGLARLQQGILLRGEEKPTLPAKVEQLSDSTVNLSIQEGRYHQVKRMFAAIDNHVTRLHRWQIAGLTLDESLEPGAWRALTAEELALLTQTA